MSSGSPDGGVSVSYDSETSTYEATFDSAVVSPSVAIVEAMAAVLETDPTDLDSLYDVIDPQGLDRVVSESVPPQREGIRTVEFSYLDHEIAVESRGRIEIRPRTDDAG